MSQKIDIAEVDAFSNDLEEISSNVRSSIDKVQERVDAVNNMESFSGKAAKEAKGYFNELHLTILESFRGLFDDLNENLNQHIKSFGTEVDASESAIIESNYLQDVKEDINEVFASLKELDENINDTIQDVSDISSATSPDFSDVQEWKKKSVKKIQEVDESKLREDSTDNFIKYLKDHDMLDNYLDDHQVLAEHIEIKEKEARLEELDPELKTIAKKAWEDFKDGLLDYESYKSLISGTFHSGGEFLKNMVSAKFTGEISEKVAGRLTDWWKRNTTTFLDRGLTLSFAHGGDLVVRETPSKLAKVLRTGAKYSPKAIGSLMDFGSQVLTGEDVGDAAIKTTGHIVAATAGSALGGVLVGAVAGQTVIPIPGVGAVAGLVGATLGPMLFDWAYDNGLKEGMEKVGDAVSGFFGKLGSVFG